MNVSGFLTECNARDISISVDGADLIVRPENIPAKTVEYIRQHKQDLIAELAPLYHLTVIECHHCGARYWHHLGHLAKSGKIAGGPCCFGHKVLTVSKYPTEAEAAAAYPWPESAGEPEHGACSKCGRDTTACTTYPDGGFAWICSRCYSVGTRSLPATEKAVTGEMVKP